MPPRHDTLFLVDILDAARLIERYTEDLDQEAFLASPLVRDAIERRLGIIGEAANKLTPELRDRYPGIPWRDIIGLRNILAHSYFSTSPTIIWKTAKVDVPELAEHVTRILDEFPSSDS